MPDIIEETSHIFDKVLEKIDELNYDEDIDGILVQMPLPSKFNTKLIQNRVDPLKDVDGLAADDIRLQMAQEALENEPNMQASDFEFKLSRPSSMYHTLQALKDKYPHREFYLLIGADNWACFDKWYAHDEIVSNYNIVVYPRKGTDVNTQHLPDRVRVVKTELYDISSTQIREYVSKGQSFENLVPSCVARIIRENNLYKQL